MKVKKFGIELKRLTRDDIELVRQKRNSPEIKRTMFFQKTISKEEQIAWFNSVNNEKNYYFIIKANGKKVGLIHGKIHSYTEKIAEGGMFIWDKACLDLHIPAIASVCMADLTFLIMKMDKTLAEVRKDNTKVINYNLALGYEIVEDNTEEGKILMELTRTAYFKKASKIRNVIKKTAQDFVDLSWDDIEIAPQDYKKLYHNLPEYLKKEVAKKIDYV